MPEADPGRTTELLQRVAAGDRAAEGELLPLVYTQLHRIAAACMAGERADHTLQPTALVHEAWLRLCGSKERLPDSRGRFLAVAGKAMRRALIDHARKRATRKRGAGAAREPLDVALDALESDGPRLLELDEALERLAEVDPELVELVEERFFAGATHEEIAAARGCSVRTVERSWRTAQTWLRMHLDAPG